MNVGLIGCGYWGKNLARNIDKSSNFSLLRIVDINNSLHNEIQSTYPNVQITSQPDDIILDPSIDVVVIATPAKSHFILAKKALTNDKHVLVEKPMSPSYTEAKLLTELSEQYNRNLIIDYTYLYSGPVRKLKEMYSSSSLGAIKSITSSRLGKGIIRDDVSVLWDLSSHDISITNFLLGSNPIAVKASITSIDEDVSNEMAALTVYYPNQIEANFECSWFSSTKERKMVIYCDEKTVLFDDALTQNKIKIVGDSSVTYPTYDSKESLSLLMSDVFISIDKASPSISDCNFGLDIIKVLEAAQFSLKNDGKLVQLQPKLNALMVDGV